MKPKEFLDAEVTTGAFKQALEAHDLIDPLLASYKAMVGEKQSSREASHERWANIIADASWIVSESGKHLIDLQGSADDMHCYSLNWHFTKCSPQTFSFEEIGRALIATYRQVKEEHDRHSKHQASADPVLIQVTYP